MADAPNLADAVDALYSAPPAGFIRSRSALVAAAKGAGATELAGQIAALRKPSAAAYLVNRLVRDGSAPLDELRDLGERLRDAQAQLDGAAMKGLAAERNHLIQRLSEAACDLDGPVTAATREQVAATLTAAVADPQAQAAVDSGALATALNYSGFGEVDLSDAIATPLRLLRGGATPDGIAHAADRDTARRDAQQAAARRSALAQVTRARAGLERAEETITSAQDALDRAEKDLAKARHTVRAAQSALAVAEGNADAARGAVGAAETSSPE